MELALSQLHLTTGPKISVAESGTGPTKSASTAQTIGISMQPRFASQSAIYAQLTIRMELAPHATPATLFSMANVKSPILFANLQTETELV